MHLQFQELHFKKVSAVRISIELTKMLVIPSNSYKGMNFMLDFNIAIFKSSVI